MNSSNPEEWVLTFVIYQIKHNLDVCLGHKYGAGHSLQWQGEEADETDEVWWLFNSAGIYETQIIKKKITI